MGLGRISWSWLAQADKDDTLTFVAKRGTLRVTVTERGNLESQKTVDGTCELNGYQNKIIFIVDEGTLVSKGDIVVRFDSAEIDKEYAAQEIQVNEAKSKVETTLQEIEVQKNLGESEIATAELELALADLDLEKYEKGDYIVQENDLRGKMALAEVELEKSREAYENFKILVKKGFREPEQLRAMKQQVDYAEYNLKRDENTLMVLEKFDYNRKITEFKAKAKEAVRKVARSKADARAKSTRAKGEHESAKATLVLEQQRLTEHNEQKGKCEILAEQAGVVAYANEDWYDSSRRIREGAVVYRRQKIFSLPDMSTMQVKVNVHESVVKKVLPKQKATVRIDAFAGLVLTGTVDHVAPLADSSRSWVSGGVKEYTTIVKLDDLPDVEIKPGMTAEVEILVSKQTDVLAVPVQSVTEHNHEHFVYVKTEQGFGRAMVKIGESNHKMVEIVSGIEPGTTVALDARSRGIADFAEEDEFQYQEEEAAEVETQPNKAVIVESSVTL